MGTQPLLIKRLLPLGIRKKPVLLCCSKFFYFGYRKTWTSGEDHLFLSPTGLDTINYYFPGVPLRICSWSYTGTIYQRSCKVLKAIFLFFHLGGIPGPPSQLPTGGNPGRRFTQAPCKGSLRQAILAVRLPVFLLPQPYAPSPSFPGLLDNSGLLLCKACLRHLTSALYACFVFLICMFALHFALYFYFVFFDKWYKGHKSFFPHCLLHHLEIFQ